MAAYDIELSERYQNTQCVEYCNGQGKMQSWYITDFTV